MRLVLILFSLSLLAWPSFADACVGGGKEIVISSEELFDRADRNGDHILSPDEFDHRGFASGEKYMSGMDSKAYLKLIDTDGDGKLTLDEWREEIPDLHLMPMCK